MTRRVVGEPFAKFIRRLLDKKTLEICGRWPADRDLIHTIDLLGLIILAITQLEVRGEILRIFTNSEAIVNERIK